MAKQMGINPYAGGSMGGVTFRKTQDGYVAQSKSSLDAERVLTAPEFAGSRCAGTGFANASRWVKHIRETLKPIFIQKFNYRRQHQDMLKIMQKITPKKTDYNTVRYPDIAQLGTFKKMELNKYRSLSSLEISNVSCTREVNTFHISHRKISHEYTQHPTDRATHFQITSGIGAFDFYQSHGGSASQIHETDWIPLRAKDTTTYETSLTLPQAAYLPVFVVTGIQLGTFINGQVHPLVDRNLTAAEIIAVYCGPAVEDIENRT